MPVSELKAGARKLMLENAPKLFFISIVFTVITTVVSTLQVWLPGAPSTYQQMLERLSAGELPSLRLLYANIRTAGIALAAVLFLILPVLDAGFMSYCLKVTRGQGGEYKDILNGFMVFGKLILIAIVTTILVALWTLLFVLPGIMAFYRYRQAVYILLDTPEKGVLQCIRESKTMMAGSKLDLFLLDLSFVGWVALDLLVTVIIPAPFAVPIVLIWLTPYMGLTRAAFFCHLVNKLVV
jgi:uncharacterized membrane protein